MSGKVCLVVSNCKSCWDTSSKLAFISNSIPDYFEAEWLKTTDHVVLDGPWESREYCLKSREFVVERVVRYRNDLSSILNGALGVNYGRKAWGFLLDSWLLHFTSVVYDRVNKLENARNQLGDVYLNCSGEDLPLALTTGNFVLNSLNDRFNQQLFGDVAEAIGLKVERCVDYLPEDDFLPVNIKRGSLKYKSFMAILWLLGPLIRGWTKYQKPVVILDGYFPLVNGVLVFLKSMGKVLIVPSSCLLGKLPETKEDKSLRMSLKVQEEDKYDLVANKLFAKCFPVSLLEGLKNYIERISKWEVIPVLGTAVGFHQSEGYKILASRVIENGNKIIGFQHGGNFNFEKNEFFIAGYFEKLDVDKYYSWKEKSFSGKSLPTGKLAQLVRHRNVRKGISGFSDILFASTNVGRFIYRQQSCSSDMLLTVILAQQNFYFRLNENVSRHFLLRPYPVDYGWRYKERWLDLTEGKVRFDPNRDFSTSLLSCRIIVIDHISTTWLEAFYIGIPVLLYFDIENYFALDEVKSLFAELQSVGVFHATPESAASFLNENYENIESWWEMPETKVVVDKVKNHFFTDSGNFVNEWTQELVALRSRALKCEWDL